MGCPHIPTVLKTVGAASTWTPGRAGYLYCPGVQSKRKDPNALWMHWACRKAGGEQESQGGGNRLPRAAEAQMSPKHWCDSAWQDVLGKSHPMRKVSVPPHKVIYEFLATAAVTCTPEETMCGDRY